jgi:sugar fermentation stimulation protein A
MRFPQPLTPGVLVSRYKRFFADVALDDGRQVTAHCPNPGAMLGLKEPGQRVWLSPSDNPKRSLAWTLELVEAGGADGADLVGVNTLTPNKLVAEALAEGLIPELAGYASVRREVKYGEGSRIDFLLTDPDRPACWLEVKNCHLRRTGALAEFPDCVAARSAKHLRELSAMVALGDRAVVLFTVQRQDCEAFAACRDIDPTFAQALDAAAGAGVEVLVWRCDMRLDGVRLARPIPWTSAPAI